MSAWPDPDRPGVPLNPEKDGWHWLYRRSDGFAAPYHWTTATDPRNGYWLYPPDWEVMPEDRLILKQDYLGPALLPAEVAAQVAAAAEAMREAAATMLDNVYAETGGIGSWAREIRAKAAAIRALPIEHGDALAAAVAQAVKQEREACIAVAQGIQDQALECAREPGLIAVIRREFQAQARGAEDVRDAIRARGDALEYPWKADVPEPDHPRISEYRRFVFRSSGEGGGHE